MERCYREHYQTVKRAAAGYLSPVDTETVVHDVFFKIMSQPATREAFRGGSLAAWLSRMATNQALDFLRQTQRVTLGFESVPEAVAPSFEEASEARLMVERFRNECLPAKWRNVFEARFIRQLDQRSAAKDLGMFRTTLAYQELRIRGLLRQFFLGEAA